MLGSQINRYPSPSKVFFWSKGASGSIQHPSTPLGAPEEIAQMRGGIAVVCGVRARTEELPELFRPIKKS
jgi:hypothetical protein